jgi:signal peptide peptidase SppA
MNVDLATTSRLSGLIQSFGRGALIAPADACGLSNLPLISSHLMAHAEATQAARDAAMDETFRATMAHYGQPRSAMGAKPFPFTANGTAIIPVHGVLLNRYNYISSYATGYNAIRSLLNAALADDDVKRIILDINSPGGMAAGAFELAADIRAGRTRKRIMAAVDGYAFSAAYAVASAADEIVMAPSGEAGSIGVVTMHVNLGPALKEFGIEVSFIYAGKHKVDGNPYEALSPEVREAIQGSVDRYYAMFVSSVAEGRGSRMSAEAARNTEARCYMAEEAVQIGLADSVMAPDAALVYAERNQDSTTPVGNTAGPAHAEKEPADMTEQNTAASAAAEARAQERVRMTSILTCEEAVGREPLARHFASETDMTVEQARAALAVAPKAAPPTEQNVLAAAMASTEQPNVGAEGGEDKDATKVSVASRIWSNYALATGGDPTAKRRAN